MSSIKNKNPKSRAQKKPSMSRVFRIGFAFAALTLIALATWGYVTVGIAEAIQITGIMLVLMLSLSALVGPIVIWAVGRSHSMGRSAIVQAADLTLAKRYVEARRWVQVAIRMNDAIANNPDAASLHRIILAGSLADHTPEVRRVRDAAASWPMTKWERWASHPVMRYGIPALWLLTILYRLIELSSAR